MYFWLAVITNQTFNLIEKHVVIKTYPMADINDLSFLYLVNHPPVIRCLDLTIFPWIKKKKKT